MKEGEKKRESKNTNEHRTKGDLKNVKYFSNFIFKIEKYIIIIEIFS